jgi:hypothetical protein
VLRGAAGLSHSCRVIRHVNKEVDMKFVLLIYQGTTPLPGSDRWNTLSQAEQKAIYADYAEINQAPGVTAGLPLGLPNAARTVQVRDGKSQVKDGPYLSEGAGGYLVFEAESMESAVALAARIPAARLGGAVEIRPAEQYW